MTASAECDMLETGTDTLGTGMNLRHGRQLLALTYRRYGAVSNPH
jgi:hypothetical protein